MNQKGYQKKKFLKKINFLLREKNKIKQHKNDQQVRKVLVSDKST